MAFTDSLIMVVNRGKAEADHLKQLIQFMDNPAVATARPSRWRERLGDHRLEALFVGPDLNGKDLDVLLKDIAEYDPNVPIVLVGEHHA
jgi:hypothetical protein